MARYIIFNMELYKTTHISNRLRSNDDDVYNIAFAANIITKDSVLFKLRTIGNKVEFFFKDDNIETIIYEADRILIADYIDKTFNRDLKYNATIEISGSYKNTTIQMTFYNINKEMYITVI